MKLKTNVIIAAVLVVIALFFAYSFYFQYGEKRIYIGTWTAKWKTPPESFQGMDVFTSFEMDGSFVFTKDSVTVTAAGFPGCVFGVDTISHTQGWSLSNDTLNLISEQGLLGISYKVNGLSEEVIELQLLEDIFISLEKAD